jgi:CBS-domain-containing membrane protein
MARQARGRHWAVAKHQPTVYCVECPGTGRVSCPIVLDSMIERDKFFAVLAGAAGGALAIGAMEFFAIRTAYPLVAIPFATSIVLVLGSPQAEPAQPRALIGGHLISTVVGLLAAKLLGPSSWVAALAVGLAIIAMDLTDTFHPPAGIDPLVVVVNDLPWSFLIAPVLIGALLLALFAFAWHNIVARGPNNGNIWPKRWW